jgi:transcription initiation factor TFIID subunit TAF12
VRNRAEAKRKALFARRQFKETEVYTTELQQAALEGEDGETDEERGEREKKADAAEQRKKMRMKKAELAEAEKDNVSDHR